MSATLNNITLLQKLVEFKKKKSLLLTSSRRDCFCLSVLLFVEKDFRRNVRLYLRTVSFRRAPKSYFVSIRL